MLASRPSSRPFQAVLVAATVLGLMTVACAAPTGGDEPSSSEESSAEEALRGRGNVDLATDMARARQTAVNLAHFLSAIRHDTERQINDTTTPARVAELMTGAFGPKLPESGGANTFQFGGKVVVHAAPDRWGGRTFEWHDGSDRPMLRVWIFFYQETLIDLRTGAVFQAVQPAGTRIRPTIATPSGHEVYGPLLPPSSARLIGSFSDAQRQELYDLIQSAAR